MIGGLSAVTLTYSGYSNDYPLKWPKSDVFRFFTNYETKKIVDEKLTRRKYAWTKSYRDEKMQ